MRLREFTSARVMLGRTGHSVTTTELLNFQLAHARARDAVHTELDVPSLMIELKQRGLECLSAKSAAHDLLTYLRRPDLGRRLSPESAHTLAAVRAEFDVVFVIADGLSALAVHRNALNVLDAAIHRLQDWRIAPVVIAQQGRVAVGDEIAGLLGASSVVILLGERPGLSAPDSLGIYMTWKPEPGVTSDAERNCISNVRVGGLSAEIAAERLVFLLNESRRRKLSGVRLTIEKGMATQTVPYITPEEYLEAERKAEYKSEYLDGHVYAMAGAKPRHTRIATNMGAELTFALKGGSCQVFNSDMRVHIPATGLYMYPDVSVVCGEPKFIDGDNLVNPTVVIEVLSAFFHYQSIPSLQEYLLLSQNPRSITHCTRIGAEDWHIETIGEEKGAIRLSIIGVELTFDQIYAGVESLPC